MTLAAELQTIRERVEGATKGPWVGDPDDPRQIRAGEDEYWLASMRGDTASRRKDAEFIAHARTDLPRLLDAVEKVLAELDHASANGHHLDRDCQGVGPGERVPAVRTENIEAAITTALEGK